MIARAVIRRQLIALGSLTFFIAALPVARPADAPPQTSLEASRLELKQQVRRLEAALEVKRAAVETLAKVVSDKQVQCEKATTAATEAAEPQQNAGTEAPDAAPNLDATAPAGSPAPTAPASNPTAPTPVDPDPSLAKASQAAVEAAAKKADVCDQELERAKVRLQDSLEARIDAEEKLELARTAAINANLSESFVDEMEAARKFRCLTALCWGKGGTEWAVEPVLDLPVGIAWSFGGGALTSYINAHKLNLEFNAGLRLWLWHDRFSILVYYADPIFGAEDKIQLSGFEHSPSAVRRPYPSVGFGLFGDVLQIGFAYDVLLNGNGSTDRDRNFRPNQVLSQSLTVTLGFTAVLTARSALAAGAFEKKRAQEAKTEGSK